MFTIKEKNHIGYNLFKDFSIIHRHSGAFLLSQLKKENLLDCHAPVLVTIYFNEGLSQNDLTNILHFHKGAIAKLTKKLEVAGYIKRIPDKEDRRIQRLYLDEKGRENISAIFAIEKECSDILIGDLTPEEISTLETLLGKVIQNVTRKETIK